MDAKQTKQRDAGNEKYEDAKKYQRNTNASVMDASWFVIWKNHET